MRLSSWSVASSRAVHRKMQRDPAQQEMDCFADGECDMAATPGPNSTSTRCADLRRCSISPARCSARSARRTCAVGQSRLARDVAPDADGLATLPTAAADGRSFTLALDLCATASRWRSATASARIAAVRRAKRSPISIATSSRCSTATVCQATSTTCPMKSPTQCRSPRTRARAPTIPTARRACSARSIASCRSSSASAPASSARRSPVHFFWGSFDLAVTRFSGRAAPPHPGGVPGLPDRITREAYSHEVSSAGFWAGGVVAAEPMFYSYAYPEPPGFRDTKLDARPVRRDARRIHPALRRSAARRRPGANADRLPPIDLRSRRRPRPMGPAALERAPVAP